MEKSELQRRALTTNVFARMVPEQKLRLVNAMRANGEVVAMTGDGGNDAPALRAAHIGIAMSGRGTGGVRRDVASTSGHERAFVRYDCGVNDLPLTIVLSWFEQKAVAVLLTLLSLNVKGIRIGPAPPAFLSPNVVKILQDRFDLKLTGSSPLVDLQMATSH